MKFVDNSHSLSMSFCVAYVRPLSALDPLIVIVDHSPPVHKVAY